MIQLSGLSEGVDIEIAFTGSRPGEKISERLFSDREKPSSSQHKKILIIEKDSVPLLSSLESEFDQLIKYAKAGDSENARKLLSKMV